MNDMVEKKRKRREVAARKRRNGKWERREGKEKDRENELVNSLCVMFDDCNHPAKVHEQGIKNICSNLLVLAHLVQRHDIPSTVYINCSSIPQWWVTFLKLVHQLSSYFS